MAKQVKVFNGDTTTSMTIYTVPVGRVAKVVAEKVVLSGGTYASASMSVGGQYAGSAQSYGNYVMPMAQPVPVAVASGSQLVFDQNMRMASISNAGYAPAVSLQNNAYYLNAGQTIQVTLGDSSNASWSFLVIEEY